MLTRKTEGLGQVNYLSQVVQVLREGFTPLEINDKLYELCVTQSKENCKWYFNSTGSLRKHLIKYIEYFLQRVEEFLN